MTQFDTDYNPGEFISVDQAVEAYGISRSTMFRLLKSGLVRYKRPGDRKTYVSRAQLREMTAFKQIE